MNKVFIGDYCEVIAGRDKPEHFSINKSSKNKIPVYANGIDNEGLVGYTDHPAITQEAVTVSARGSIGTPFYRNKPYVPIIRLISIIPDNKYLDCLYLYYLLKNSNISGTGSVQAQLTVPMVKQTMINIIKDINVQKSISQVLSTIDNKIANNDKIFTEFESLARTIYDYWFVQFDFPDENGRPYKSSGGKMVWNERLQREIPDGWRVGCIADITANVTDGEHGTILNENHSGYYLLSCKNIIGGRLCYDESARQVSLKSFEKMRKRTELAEGDVLVSSVGTIGEACVMTADCDHVEFQRSVAILKPDYSKISSEWLYETMLSMKPIMQRNAHGAIQQCIFISDIKNLFVVIPPSQIIEIYTDKVQSLLKLKIKKEEENQKLASLRDFLLPLLMNGQVSFKSDSI